MQGGHWTEERGARQQPDWEQFEKLSTALEKGLLSPEILRKVKRLGTFCASHQTPRISTSVVWDYMYVQCSTPGTGVFAGSWPENAKDGPMADGRFGSRTSSVCFLPVQQGN